MKVVVIAVKEEEDVEAKDFTKKLKELRKKYAEKLKTNDITLKVV